MILSFFDAVSFCYITYFIFYFIYYINIISYMLLTFCSFFKLFCLYFAPQISWIYYYHAMNDQGTPSFPSLSFSPWSSDLAKRGRKERKERKGETNMTVGRSLPALGWLSILQPRMVFQSLVHILQRRRGREIERGRRREGVLRFTFFLFFPLFDCFLFPFFS